jgi:hypothetical protein
MASDAAVAVAADAVETWPAQASSASPIELAMAEEARKRRQVEAREVASIINLLLVGGRHALRPT